MIEFHLAFYSYNWFLKVYPDVTVHLFHDLFLYDWSTCYDDFRNVYNFGCFKLVDLIVGAY